MFNLIFQAFGAGKSTLALTKSRKRDRYLTQAAGQTMVEQLEQRRLLSSNGLNAEYFDGADADFGTATPAATQVDPAINFIWNSSNEPPVSSDSDFSAHWSGYLEVPGSGTSAFSYTFQLRGIAKVELTIDGQSVIDHPYITGDLNDDGVVNNGDIAAAAAIYVDPPTYAAAHPSFDMRSADLDGNGNVNNQDNSLVASCILDPLSFCGTGNISLVPGERYSISIDYRNLVSSPSLSLVYRKTSDSTWLAFPATHLLTGTTGVRATYFDDTELAGYNVQDVEDNVNFSGVLDSSIDSSTFSADWQSTISVPSGGSYQLKIQHRSNAVELLIDGTPVVNQWYVVGDTNGDGVLNNQDISGFTDELISHTGNPAADINGDGIANNQDISPFTNLLIGNQITTVGISISAGSHDIELKTFSNVSDASMELLWNGGSGSSYSAIPDSALTVPIYGDRPLVPDNLTASQFDGITSFNWNSNSPEADGYEIWGLNSDNNWELVGDVGSGDAQIGAAGTLDSQFAIRAYTESGSVRTYSNFSSIASPSTLTEALKVSAAENEDNQIELQWPASEGDGTFRVVRRVAGGSTWSLLTMTALSGSTTSYTDTTGASGTAYEYAVIEDGNTPAAGIVTDGVSVDRTAEMANRGIVDLIVDGTVAPYIQPEIAQLEQDLIGDGWQVILHDNAPRQQEYSETKTTAETDADNTASVAAVHEMIVDDYSANMTDDVSSVKSVFLIGHVAIPMSGFTGGSGTPYDSHGNRDWSADIYYGDVDGVWHDQTDYDVPQTLDGQGTGWLPNLAGDGRFDENGPPPDGDASPVELAVGRIDFAKSHVFSQTEIELLQGYLEKDHAWRAGQVTNIADQALVDYSNPNDHDFASLVGADNVVSDPGKDDWIGELSRTDQAGYLWAGAGTHAENLDALWGLKGGDDGTNSDANKADVGSSTDLANNPIHAVFTTLFGSYIADWNNDYLNHTPFLMSVIANPSSSALTAVDGFNTMRFEGMAVGDTIGDSVMFSENLVADENKPTVYYSLLGDPTLRMNVVAPPRDVEVTPSEDDGDVIDWTASSDTTVTTYKVYRQNASAGWDYVGDTSSTELTDPDGGSDIYMVRAEKLETTGSGSYYNLSQGAFSTGSLVSVGLQNSGTSSNQLVFTFDKNIAVPTSSVILKKSTGEAITVAALDSTPSTSMVFAFPDEAGGILGSGTYTVTIDKNSVTALDADVNFTFTVP
jgi:PA14 domain